MSATPIKDAYLLEGLRGIPQVEVQWEDASLLFAQQLATAHPLVKRAYDELGESQVQQLKYHVGNIQRKLDARMDGSTIYKVVTMCKRVFSLHRPTPLTVIKTELQAIYDELGIQRTAKATDILEWCEAKGASVYLSGKKVKCLTIIRYSIARIK